jgi:hypothetical protein
VTVVEDNDPAYHQALKMSRLARQAYDEGADWVLPVDADELFYCEGQTLAEFFAGCEFDVVAASVWDHIATRSDSKCPNPWARIEHRRKLAAAHVQGGVPRSPGGDAARRQPRRRAARLPHDRHVRSPRAVPEPLTRWCARSRTASWRWRRRTSTRCTVRTGGSSEPRAIEALGAEWQALCDEPDLVFDPAPYRGEL